MKWYYQKEELEVGIDEVARGCMFGRVYTGAVVWPYDEDLLNEHNEMIDCPIQKDSKQYTATQRENLYEYILDNALEIQYSYCDANTIDKVNILQATYQSMHQSLDQLTTAVDRILVDGDKFKPYIKINDNEEEWIPYVCFPKGDTLYLPISAASIVAKVEHDKYIERICNEFPELDDRYDLLSNMGYGSKKHMDGIANYGISQFHRKSFGKCKTSRVTVV